MPQIMKRYDYIVRNIALKYNIDSFLIHSIILAESNYNNRAISSKGAKGLMQLMPETAKKYGVKDVFNARENIEGGVKYLKDLIKLYKGNLSLVLAAYNAGHEAIEKYGGIPPYPETKNYIQRVMASYKRTTIRTKTPIYMFYDDSGKVVLTNNPHLFLFNRNNKRANKDS